MTLKEYARDTLKTYIKIFKSSFAEKDGDPTQSFQVAQPSANYDAVNRQYADSNYAVINGETDQDFRVPYTPNSNDSAINKLYLSNNYPKKADFYAYLYDFRYYNDSTDREFSTSWADGWSSSTISIVPKTRYVELDFHLAARNDSTNWGGVGSVLFYSLDGGSWTEAGRDNYGGNVMIYSSQGIGTQSGFYRLYLSSGGSSIKFKFVHKAYDGTAWVNKNCSKSGAFVSSFKFKIWNTF
jgi:hypothetical protein